MLALTTTPAPFETAEQVVNMKPLLIEGVDFKCTPKICYGIGPIHGTLRSLQYQLNRVTPSPHDGFVSEEMKIAAERAAEQILNLYGRLSQPGLLPQYKLNIGLAPMNLLRALQSGQLSRKQITEWTVALMQLFRLGADAAARYGSWA